jgi:O-antigen/teichoic acid export membrane protein
MHRSLILRAVTTSWIAVAANAAVGFLLTPYILHHLGDEAYGLWVLTVTCVGYYGLLDIGVRSSILRYVSRHQALGDLEGVNQVVATAFYYYLAACAVILVATFASVGPVSHFFSIRSDLVPAFKSLYILAGAVQGCTLPLVVFAGSLEAAGRFDQMYLTTVAGLAIRVVAIVTVIHLGGGLFSVGAATLLSQLFAYCIQVPLCFRANPGMSLRPHLVRRTVFRDMLRYGSVSVTVGIGERMRGYIYPLLIARFLSPVAVTLFALPVKLMQFPTDGIGTMTEIINPLSSRLEAQKDFSKLRQLILNSSQTAFMLLIPLAAFLIIFGRNLLSLWVGSRYTSAYPLLVLLALGLGAAATQCCMQSMLFGIERHKALIWYRLGEGLSVIIIGSIALKVWGLIGFASVIAVTLLTTSLLLVPRHLCKILGLSLRRYLIEGVLKPLILALPAIAVYAAIHRTFQITGWRDLLLAAFAGGSVYALTLLIAAIGSSRTDQKWYSVDILQALAHRFLPTLRPSFKPAIKALGTDDSQIEW